jgi:hypothetical protein
MPLLLPNLDDRTWADLTDEGRALIPVYGPEWTDHNASDPGITLMELLAWIAEMDIYRLNQISDRERLKFLALVGIVPEPPHPAHAVLSIFLKSGIPPVKLPLGLEFTEPGSAATGLRYRTLSESTLVPGHLVALQFFDGLHFQNLTPAWNRGGVLYPFGPGPQTGMEFYLGFSDALPVGTPAQIFFTFADGHSGPEARYSLLRELEEMEKQCDPATENPCAKNKKAADHKNNKKKKSATLLKHYGVRTAWEFLASVGSSAEWRPLDPQKNEVVDATRSFTLDGTVTLRVPQPMAKEKIGSVSKDFYYVRCRFEAGRYDAAPAIEDVAFNGIEVQQAVAEWMSFVIDLNAAITYSAGGPPKPNDQTTVRMRLDDYKKITSLNFTGGSKDDPQFRVLDFVAPAAGKSGKLDIEGVFLGFGTGLPNQQMASPDAPVQQCSFELYSLEENHWHRWNRVADFDSSTCKDFHFVLDPTAGSVTFGDGAKGRVPGKLHLGPNPDEKCVIFAIYRETQAQQGNLAAKTITEVADSPHNHALLYDSTIDGWKKLKAQLDSITNTLAASGGAAAETIAHASGRADALVETSKRAVTLADYEKLALATPGTRIARVTARANLHPSFPCLHAPGMITVIVLPYLPQGRPSPTPGLLAAVTAYLRRHRIIGTRVEVIGPTYTEVAVQATVQSKTGTNKGSLQQAIVNALNSFLDPLTGGPDGTGWPFGRDVYRAEIMKIIDEVSGVDHVVSMDLIGDHCHPTCGNVCLAPTWLVAAVTHAITVL